MAKQKPEWLKTDVSRNKPVIAAIDAMVKARQTATQLLSAELVRSGVKVPEGHELKVAWGFDGKSPVYAVVPKSNTVATGVVLGASK